MKFESKKDTLFTILVLGINALCIGIVIHVLFIKETVTQDYWGALIIVAVVLLLFWIFYGTHYELTKDALIYKSGPIRGKISINRITEIEKGKTLWVGLKPATSQKGLIIKYDKYNEIYISPKTNDAFIKKILELNSNIKITE